MPKQIIERISVKGLFGLYSYRIPQSDALSEATILYGENGVGKSTLLHLVFHLLSPESNRRHRTALWETEFEQIEVILNSGVRISATKGTKESDGPLLFLRIHQGSRLEVEWPYVPSQHHFSSSVVEELSDIHSYMRDRLERRMASESLEQNFLSTLKRHAPTVFLLTADRRFDSDSIPDASDEIELRRSLSDREPRKLHELVGRAREVALVQALNRVARWISQKSVRASNLGSNNVRTVYEEVLDRLSNAGQAAPGEDQVDLLKKKLLELEEQSRHFAKYELTAHHPAARLLHSLEGLGPQTAISAQLIKPYLESVEKRLNAIQPIYLLVDQLITTINELLFDKKLSFKLGEGFTITNSRTGRRLQPAQLSSGEQHLLLLFCLILTARDSSSVFLIDEPELSLNVKWQRQLVAALLASAGNTSTQFVFASHSVELLSQHIGRVVQLKSE
jgi:energy-coupling factor transporter ATP-binding protein EcfA2